MDLWTLIEEYILTPIANFFYRVMRQKARNIGFDSSVDGNLLFQEMLKFTHSDLVSNREGSMSQSQLEQAINNRNANLALLTAVGIVALGLGLAYITSDLFITILVILVAGACFFLDYTSYLVWTKIIDRGKVSLMQGKIEYKVGKQGLIESHNIIVGKIGHDLEDVPNKAREKIQAMEGQMVRVYYLPQVNRWLSMELLENVISDE